MPLSHHLDKGISVLHQKYSKWAYGEIFSIRVIILIYKSYEVTMRRGNI
jgi:hypothetical protein